MFIVRFLLTSNMRACVYASQLYRDPRQDEVEVELVRDKNTSRSKGGRSMSSTMSKG